MYGVIGRGLRHRFPCIDLCHRCSILLNYVLCLFKFDSSCAPPPELPHSSISHSNQNTPLRGCICTFTVGQIQTYSPNPLQGVIRRTSTLLPRPVISLLASTVIFCLHATFTRPRDWDCSFSNTHFESIYICLVPLLLQWWLYFVLDPGLRNLPDHD